MGRIFKKWICRDPRWASSLPDSFTDLESRLYGPRNFQPDFALEYGDYGLEESFQIIKEAVRSNKKIALYADYDVDGTMSAVSWIWFLKAIGHERFVYHIPCRFTEGYGVNLKAVQKLIHEDGAELIITMDTGITANEEAAYCRAQGVDFICTDHHEIQPEKMPDCTVLNPKLHPDPYYKDLCGAGITFVLLRKLGQEFQIPPAVWTDLLALAGMATICDMVPLNPVNHQLARKGCQALIRSRRPILQTLLEACAVQGSTVDEKDLGFKLGPRINAVGRLEHGHTIVRAFAEEDDPTELVRFMNQCNERRKHIQQEIADEALERAAQYADDPILFMGGNWHQGVVGICASRVMQKLWKPTWLFDASKDVYKGSARATLGFDVTAAMAAPNVRGLWKKFGGHKAAGGFAFDQQNESKLREALNEHAIDFFQAEPELALSSTVYDTPISFRHLNHRLLAMYDSMKPFGLDFPEPVFHLSGPLADIRLLRDKKTGQPKHTKFLIKDEDTNEKLDLLYFNEVFQDKKIGQTIEALVTVDKNNFRGQSKLQLIGVDLKE